MRASTIRKSLPSADRRRVGGLLLSVAALVAATAIAAETPSQVVHRLADQVLAVLKDQSLSSDAKRERLEAIADTGVDFETLSRLVLARNWPRFTPEEQATFVKEFRRHLSVTYGKSIDSYRNEEMEIIGDREEARGDWTVKTKILRGNGNDIYVDYRLRKSGDEWKVIDFVVEGVSLVANFRSQFQDLLASKTPAQLNALLHEKNAKGEVFEGVAPKPKE